MTYAPRKLTLAERLVVQSFLMVNQFGFGFRTAFAEELVRALGIKGMMKWAEYMDRATKALEPALGPALTQLVIGFSALWNGCEYCSRGHTLAANLEYLKEHGKLFPISEDDIAALQRMPDTEVLAALDKALVGPELARPLALLRRQYELKAGTAQGTTPDDALLSLAVAAWDWTNECSIVVNQQDVPPLSKVAKDKALLARYRALRPRAAGPAGA